MILSSTKVALVAMFFLALAALHAEGVNKKAANVALRMRRGHVKPQYVPPRPKEVMYVWVGGNGKKDFLACVDFDPSSPTYGTEIAARTYLPANTLGVQQTGNEPHHIGATSTRAGRKTYIGVGGLLSVLAGKNDIFMFEAENPFSVC
jgi:hypothetical protein